MYLKDLYLFKMNIFGKWIINLAKGRIVMLNESLDGKALLNSLSLRVFESW